MTGKDRMKKEWGDACIAPLPIRADVGIGPYDHLEKGAEYGKNALRHP